MDIKERYGADISAERHFWEISRTRFVWKLIRKYFPDVHSVADIGCGDCAVLSVLAKKYSLCSFVGVDTALSEEMLKEMKSVLPENVQLANDWGYLTGKSELVLLLDVLEHVANPGAFLADLYKRILPGGSMIVTVPAFQSLFSEHDIFLQHYRRYAYPALRKELEVAGFQIITGGYFFSLLLLPRIIQKILHVSAAGDKALKPGKLWLNRLAAFVLTLDTSVTYFLCQKGIRIPGLSCFCIVKRQQGKKSLE